ncbi:MAG TPA: folate-binding protein [Methylococcus sp.]|nr:folate-binding protein [Methylococcus sp.]
MQTRRETKPETTPQGTTCSDHPDVVQVVPLAELGILAVEGSDAETLLHGQTTCDVRRLLPGDHTLGAVCTAKGRAVAVFHLLKAGDERFLLLLPHSLVDPLRKRLQLFVLRSKVTITDETNRYSRYGLIGPNLEALEDWVRRYRDGEVVTLTLPATSGSRVLVIARGDGEAFWNQCLTEECIPAPEERWKLEDIRMGVPLFPAELSEEFVPQMLNLELLGGISFTKGCYTGQEIVARAQYLGQIKRRLYRFRLHSDTLPLASAPIFREGQGQPVGKVVCIASAGGSAYELLAVGETEGMTSGALRFGAPEGPLLVLLPLPHTDYSYGRMTSARNEENHQVR